MEAYRDTRDQSSDDWDLIQYYERFLEININSNCNYSNIATSDKDMNHHTSGGETKVTTGMVEVSQLYPSLLEAEHVLILEDQDSGVWDPESECTVETADASQDTCQPDSEVQIVTLPKDFQQEMKTLCALVGNGDVLGLLGFILEHEDDIGAICLVSDDTGRTPITAAAVGGYVDVLRTLSDAGVWLHCYDEAGYMAIHRAVDAGHQEVVEWLCGQGQWTGFTKSGLSALHIAAQNGHFAITNLLVDFVPNIDEETTATIGQTALHLAVQNNHVDVTELLIGRGAKCNYANGDGKNALHLAAESGNADIVDKILSHGNEDIDDKISGSLKSALHVAVENSHSQVVCKLLDYGANVDQPDGQGDTVLHKLCSSGLPSDCVDYMCSLSADIDMCKRDGRSALFLAVEKGKSNLCGVLLKHGANPNVNLSNGCTVLLSATHNGLTDIVRKLIQAGVDINRQTVNGTSALYEAARSGHRDIVAVLISSGVCLNVARKTGWTALHVAIHHRHGHVVEQLINAGANVNATDNQGQTPLAIAAYNKSAHIVKILEKTCKDPLSIFNVAKLGNSEILKLLRYCDFDLEAANPLCGWRAIHHAAIEGNSKALLALARAGLDINSQDNDGNTALHLAVLHKKGAAVEALLDQFCSTTILNKHGETVVSMACRRGFTDIVLRMLRRSVVFDEADAFGKRPLIHALENGHLEVVRLLIHYGASIKAYSNDPAVPSPARLLCQNGDAETLKLMVQRRASLDERDMEGNTLLHTAAKHGNTDVVFELINARKSLMNSQNRHRKTPLHLAASEGHLFIVEALLSAGAKVCLVDQDQRVDYDMAKHRAVWDVLKEWAKVNPSMLEPARNNPQIVSV